MVEALVLEKFVTAVACLCASSYGPNVSPKNNLRATIASAVNSWDRDVLQIFVNSKRTFSYHDSYGDCELPDSDAFDARIFDLEYETQKQSKESNKLIEEIERLRANCKEPKQILVTADEEQLNQIKAQVEVLGDKISVYEAAVNETDEENKKLIQQHKTDQDELEKLRTQIQKLNEELHKVTTTSKPKTKNGCLLTKKHGVSNLEICLKQNIFCAKDLNSSKYGDGWMLVSQRFDGSQHFFLDWLNYVEGFGRHGANFEFFIGLERIHTLTRSAQYELLIILNDIYNQTRYAHYDNFAIGDATQVYELKTLGNYTGDAGDSLSYHLKQKFSTFDKSNLSKCAEKHTGAWWYKENDCHRSNLFGLYRTLRPKNDFHKFNGMIWSTFHNTNDGRLMSMRMYLRPKENV